MSAELAAALLSLGRLREVWPWLAEAVEPGRASWHERDLSPTAREQLDQQAITERAYKTWNARLGLKALAPAPSPARIAALDARAAVADALGELAWLVSSSLRMRPGMAYRLWGRTTDERVAAAMEYVSTMLPHCPDDQVVADGARRLADVDRQARAAANVGEDRRVVKADCPACGRRSLYAEIGSPNEREWVILCGQPSCRCQGVDCGCKRPVRYAGPRHMWLRWEWEQLADRLGVVAGRLVDGGVVHAAVTIADGAPYVTAEAALLQLGEDVTVAMMRRWVERKRIPKVRHRNRMYYPLELLVEAEYEARTKPDGRKRRVA